MSRLLPILLLAIASPAVAEPPATAKALEDAMHKIIDGAKQSIGCVLISRSESYKELDTGPSATAPWQLGGFNAEKYLKFADGPRQELVRRLDLANPATVPEAYGSCVVVDDRGLVLTNYHVIEGATKIYVRLQGKDRGSYADIVAADGRSDLAVLKLQAPPSDLKAIKFGDGSKVRSGNFVVVLAKQFSAGFEDADPNMSWGFVSRLRTKLPGPSDESKRAKPLWQFPTMIEMAQLNLGCSGGALLDLNGDMVGLTTAMASQTGGEKAAGYAIPLDANVKRIIEVLNRGEEVEYGFLGVTVSPRTRSSGSGVAIADVAPGLPASRAGMQPDDVVTSINGNPIREQEDLFFHLSAALAGTETKIEVLRRNVPQVFKPKLAKSQHSEPSIASNRPKPVFGVRVDYSSTLSFDADPPEGVVIRAIEPNSPAEKKLKEWKYRAGLIVVKVNGKSVPTPADFYREAAGKSSVTLEIVEAVRDSGSTRKEVTLP